MTRLFSIVLILLISAPAIAELSEERKSTRAKLLADLKTAKTEPQGRRAETAIRNFWLRGSSLAQTTNLLTAIQARRHYHFKKALALLDYVIANDPEYAEAYNQRAFIHFLTRNYEKALKDIELALKYEPKHFGALTGRAIIFLHQGRIKLARQALIEAIAIHPWLKERAFLSRLPTTSGSL